MADLSTDIEFMNKLKEILKYEFILYEFAKQVHHKQVDWVKGQRKNEESERETKYN